MADEEDKEDPQSQPASEDEGSASRPKERSRRTPLTPEQRRFLGPARSWHDPSEPAVESVKSPEAPVQSPEETEPSTSEFPPAPKHKKKRRTRGSGSSRVLEMQNVALIIGGLILFGITFYVGKNYQYWRYTILSRNRANLSATEANKFPGVPAEELVEQALVAEHTGNWQEAANRYVAAKYKNSSYAEILFRAGKLYYDHAAFDAADNLFGSAVAFGENIDAANYYRGMIALGREDYPAAERFFEAASNAAPFKADYFYSWAETLRKDRHPREAIARYQQAALRATEQEAIVCRFKARMASVEAGDVDQLTGELAKKRSEGALSADWWMTAAALQIRAANIPEAVRMVEEGRASDKSYALGLFAACAGDRYFTNAGENSQELAQACRIETAATPPPR